MTRGGEVKRALMLVALLAGMLASPAMARKLDAHDMLVASSPAKDGIVTKGIDTIILTFAEPAEVISVTVRLPDDTEINAQPETGSRRLRQLQVRFSLPSPLATGGDYTISYLLTSKSFMSLNGFIEFEIAGDAEPALPGTSSGPAQEGRR